MNEHLERFAAITRAAQRMANSRGGEYTALSEDELCRFMVRYDDALKLAEDAGAVRASD